MDLDIFNLGPKPKRIPKAFTYLGMMCVFVMLNPSCGTALFKIIPNDDASRELSIESIIKLIESDKVFDVFVSMYYNFTVYTKHVFVKVKDSDDDESAGEIYVELTGILGVDDVTHAVTNAQIAINSPEDTIFRKSIPLTRRVKTYDEFGDVDDEYDREFIIDVGVTAPGYSHCRRKCTPYIIRCSVTDTTDLTSMEEIPESHKKYDMRTHQGLFLWLMHDKESPIREAMEVLNQYLSPTGLVQFKDDFSVTVLPDKLSTELVFVWFPYSTNLFRLETINPDHMVIYTKSNAEIIKEKNTLPFITYMMSNEGIIFNPKISNHEVAPCQYDPACRVNYTAGGVILDKNLIYNKQILDMCTAEEYAANFIATVPINIYPADMDGCRAYIPVTEGELPCRGPLAYFKADGSIIANEEHYGMIKALCGSYTTDDLALLLLAESNAECTFALVDQREDPGIYSLFRPFNYSVVGIKQSHTTQEIYDKLADSVMQQYGDKARKMWQTSSYYHDIHGWLSRNTREEHEKMQSETLPNREMNRTSFWSKLFGEK